MSQPDVWRAPSSEARCPYVRQQICPFSFKKEDSQTMGSWAVRPQLTHRSCAEGGPSWCRSQPSLKVCVRISLQTLLQSRRRSPCSSVTTHRVLRSSGASRGVALLSSLSGAVPGPLVATRRRPRRLSTSFLRVSFSEHCLSASCASSPSMNESTAVAATRLAATVRPPHHSIKAWQSLATEPVSSSTTFPKWS